jgi:hypothetical protein
MAQPRSRPDTDGMREALITTTLLSIYAAARGGAMVIGAIQTRPTR